jgi:hypothetical protein
MVRHTQATNPNGLLIDYSGSGYTDTYALRIQNTDGVIWDQRGTGSLMHYAQDGATVRFNTGAANVDFQVKSDSQSNAFFVDASTGEIVTNTYGFNIYNYDDGPNLNISSGRDYNSLMMGAAANYGSNNSVENKWSWNWRGRPSASSQHYNFLYDEIGNKEMFRVQADASQTAVVVNDGGHNHDFRVESDNNANMLRVDAQYDAVVVGSSGVNLQQDPDFAVNSFGLKSFAINSNTLTDTGISLNQDSGGMACMVMASNHYSAGTSTRAAMYFLQFYYSGNNAPAVTQITGTTGLVTFGTSANNTLTVQMPAGGNAISFLMSG